MSWWDAVDLFAGPGGWEEATKALGLRVVGLELEANACRTAVAAGHVRVQADVRTLPLEPFAGIPGLIASPPCPTFSSGGNGSGRRDLEKLLQAIKTMGTGEWPQAQLDACEDDRTALTVEPLRWALVLHPEWLAWEQVPAVLPVWEACAEVLRAEGYSVATGVVYAEQHGVPQARKRAVLVASRVREVALPAPTHTRYVKTQPRSRDGLLPWVSMADVLGGDGSDLVGFARRADTADVVSIDGVDYRARDLRAADQPAQAVTEKARSWLRFGMRGGGTEQLHRHVDHPAPTLAFGRDRNSWCWAAEVDKTVRVGDDRTKLTLAEASVLQTFPADYPWQGTPTACFHQVANAVPPLLALAVLEAAT